MLVRYSLITIALLVGCSSQTRTAAAAPATAEAKARELLQHQLDVSKGSPDAVKKTFTDDAVVFTKGKATTVDIVTFFGLADGGPDGMKAEKATIAKLLAGGNSDAIWFYAEVAVKWKTPAGGKESSTTRVIEVATAADQWKVVAAAFGEGGELAAMASNREIENATAADGPLAKLLGAPDAAAAKLAPDAIVVGPTTAVQGKGARDALASWKLEPMHVFKRAREVRTATWGFAQANLDHPVGADTDRVAGLVVAVPEAGGGWRVVLAQYVNR